MPEFIFTGPDGGDVIVTATDEQEARFKKQRWLDKQANPPSWEGSGPANLLDKMGIDPQDAANYGAALPAAIESTARSVASTFGIGDEEEHKQVLDRNRPLFESGPGMLTEMGVQGVALAPLAMTSAASGPAIMATKLATKYPRLVKSAKNMIEAVTGGGLIAEPDDKAEVAGAAGGIQGAIEGLTTGLPKAARMGTKYAGMAADKLHEVVAEIFRKNPGLELTQVAEKLKEMIPGIDIPTANAAANAFVKRGAQIGEYVPGSGSVQMHEKAELAIRNRLMDIAEGRNAPPTGLPGPDKTIMEMMAGMFSKRESPEWRAMNERYKRMAERTASDYDRLINNREFDVFQTYNNIVEGLGNNSNPMWVGTLDKIKDMLKSTVNRTTRKIPGSTIGTLKRELRHLRNNKDATIADQDAIDMVLKQLDEDIAKQLPVLDADYLKELNSMYPERKIMEDAIAGKPLGDFLPNDARTAMEGMATRSQLAKGDARGQELIDAASIVMKRKPPNDASPFAVRAVTAALTVFLPIAATGRTQIAKDLRRGDIPKYFKVPKGYEKKWEAMFKDMSVSEIEVWLTAMSAEQMAGEE